jgi:hypothetical protein
LHLPHSTGTVPEAPNLIFNEPLAAFDEALVSTTKMQPAQLEMAAQLFGGEKVATKALSGSG